MAQPGHVIWRPSKALAAAIVWLQVAFCALAQEDGTGMMSSVPVNNATGGCTPSSLGYQCQVQQQSALIHYSLNRPMPVSICRNTSDEGVSSTDVLHVAIQANTKGYVALSFPKSPGQMYPADAIIGWVQDQTNAADVNSYHLTNYSPDKSSRSEGWAFNLGVVQSGGTLTVCFSRPLVAPAAISSPNIDPTQALGLNYAIHNFDGFGHHETRGAFTLDLSSGQTVSAGEYTPKTHYIRVHGALMATTFALLLPLGAYIARFKEPLFRDRKVFGKHVWFYAHQATQLSGLVLFLTSFIIAFVELDMYESKLGKAHKWLGVALMVMIGLQVLFSPIRPSLSSSKRFAWNQVHRNWGRLAILAGLANVFIGITLYHRAYDEVMWKWLLPCVLVPGVLILVGLTLEVLQYRRRNRSMYEVDRKEHVPSKADQTSSLPNDDHQHARDQRSDAV